MRKNLLVGLAALTLLGAGSVSAQNLVLNGNFEADIGDVGDGGFTNVAAGSTLIDGWTVTGNVDLVRNNYGAVSSVSVDLNGSPGRGGISQDFATLSGTTYTLDFDYQSNGSDGFPLKVLFGHFGGGVAAPITDFAEVTGTGHGHLSFVGTGATARLFLFTQKDVFGGPVVDNITVTAVPEPESYAMMLLGLGALGFMGRRRRAG